MTGDERRPSDQRHAPRTQAVEEETPLSGANHAWAARRAAGRARGLPPRRLPQPTRGRAGRGGGLGGGAGAL